MLDDPDLHRRISMWLRKISAGSRKHFSTIGRVLFGLHPPGMEDECHQEDARWFRELRAVEGVEYDLALDYAKEKYREEIEAFDVLDGKAERLFQLTAILAGAVISGAKILELAPNISLYGSFFCFLIAMILAAIARWPVSQHSPMKVRRLVHHLENAGKGGQTAKLKLAASLHCAHELTRVASDWKADKISAATVFVAIGIFLLFPAMLSAVPLARIGG